MNRTTAIGALAFGVFLAVAETARNWGSWQWWPFWLVDFIAAGLLVTGGAMVVRRARGGGRVLCGAWGFTTAMFYGSFWSHVENAGRPADGNLEEGPLTVVIGIMWVVTIVGFALSLLSAGRHTGPPKERADAGEAGSPA
jgi:hypothetical protein